MKNKILIVLLPLMLLIIVMGAGCAPSYATSEQVAALQNQVNTLNASLNSTQQQLASTQRQLTSTQQQLDSVQQSLTQAQTQLQQQKTYATSSQPVYQSGIIYRSYPYITPWYQYPGYSQPYYPRW